MTVSSSISRMDFIGNGTLDTYPFNFEIYVKTDLDVYVSGVLKTVDVHYGISGTPPKYGINDPDGGNVVFIDIPTAGQAIAIILDLPLTQLINYVEGDKFPAETHERGLDRLVKLGQALSNRLDSVLKIPIYSTLGNIEVPVAAGEVLAWNGAGTAIVTVPTWEPGYPLPLHGDDHENVGIDEISVTGLSGLLTDDQHVLDAEVLAVAEDKTNKGAISGYPSLNASSLVVQNPANATATPTASKIPIADGSGKLDGWVTLGEVIPLGVILAYGGTVAPSGYLMCQGAEVSRTTYANLFAIIGIAYGAGNGSTTFNLPDLQQRFPLGKAASGTGSTLGGTGGAIDHTHTGPSHTHAIQNSATLRGDTVNVEYGVSVQAGLLRTISRTSADDKYTASSTTTAAGTGVTGLNNPPFQVVNYIIKT